MCFSTITLYSPLFPFGAKGNENIRHTSPQPGELRLKLRDTKQCPKGHFFIMISVTDEKGVLYRYSVVLVVVHWSGQNGGPHQQLGVSWLSEWPQDGLAKYFAHLRMV